MATFYNKATLTYSNGTADSNIVTGELVEVLSATKYALETDYESNCPTTYLINIVNSGANAFTGLTVTDNLGEYAFGAGTRTPLTYVADSIRYFSNGTLQPASAVTAEPALAISGITVPANGNVMIAYKAYANEYAPLGADAKITNTATISGPGLPNDIEVSDTVTHVSVPDLSISKTLSPDTVTENGEVTYTFIIQNKGSAAALVDDNVALTDTFSPALANLTATLNSSALTADKDYTYDAETGVFQTVAGQITVPAAAYSVDSETGAWSVTPGVTVLKVTGTIR